MNPACRMLQANRSAGLRRVRTVLLHLGGLPDADL